MKADHARRNWLAEKLVVVEVDGLVAFLILFVLLSVIVVLAIFIVVVAFFNVIVIVSRVTAVARAAGAAGAARAVRTAIVVVVVIVVSAVLAFDLLAHYLILFSLLFKKKYFLTQKSEQCTFEISLKKSRH